jgi:CheY-like chemotaxis protein/Tfp pilus assembly protein PilF
MRLEFESNASDFTPVNGTAPTPNNQEKFAEYLNSGVKAAQAGDRKTARKNLMSALDIDPQSENAWLWLASISEYPEELLVFLNNVLDINPKNERALQWSASTKLLLSKTLVQRGIDAHENGRQDFAVQCFDQALSYDMHNVTAWLWLAALNDSEECRLEYFRRVLEIDPENETAKNAIDASESGKRDNIYANAAWCAVNGDVEGAHDYLNSLFERWPEDKDGWTLMSHLSSSFNEKLDALKHILDIDHEDEYANAALGTLSAIADASRSYSVSEAERVDAPVAINDEPSNEPMKPAESTPVVFAPVDEWEENHEVESISTGELNANDVYFEDEQPVPSELETATFETEAPIELPEQPVEHVEAAAVVYEPVEAEDNAIDHQSENDPFATVAEPISKPEVADDRLKILVVENNPTARKLMAGKLENSGYSVLCAESGRQAIDMAKSVQLDLVLADIAMPGMDGYAICRMLRDMELNELPIILISGKDGYYEEGLGEAAGATGFITKPFGPETLMKTVENFLAVAAPNR